MVADATRACPRLSLAGAAVAFQPPGSKSLGRLVDAAAPILAAGVLATGAMPVWAGDAAAGEVIFSGNCAACHAGGRNIIQPEKTLEKVVRLGPLGLALCTPDGTCPSAPLRMQSRQEMAVWSPPSQAIETYLDGGFNEASVVRQVTNGKNAMPAFGGRLSDSDIANVATYVISASSEGWD